MFYSHKEEFLNVLKNFSLTETKTDMTSTQLAVLGTHNYNFIMQNMHFPKAVFFI